MAWNAMRFTVKHTVAATVVVGGFMLFTAASYFALLLWAVLAGEPLGGPLAFPFMVAFALVAGVVSVLLALFPATVAAEWICRKRRMAVALQIPLATLLLVAGVLASALVIAGARGTSIGAASWGAMGVTAVLLVPLGAYWWSLQSTDWLVGLGAKWSKDIQRRWLA